MVLAMPKVIPAKENNTGNLVNAEYNLLIKYYIIGAKCRYDILVNIENIISAMRLLYLRRNAPL